MRLGTRSRAASTVEYALILVAVLLLGAGGFKLLGGKLGSGSNRAGTTITSGDGTSAGTTGGGGGGGSGGGGGGGGGSMGGGVGSKVSMGGVGGVSGDGATRPGSNRDTGTESGSGGGGAPRSGGVSKMLSGGDVSEGFGGKRWFGIGLLAAGVIAITYVLASMRRAKKAADSIGGKDGKAGKLKPKPRQA